APRPILPGGPGRLHAAAGRRRRPEPAAPAHAGPDARAHAGAAGREADRPRSHGRRHRRLQSHPAGGERAAPGGRGPVAAPDGDGAHRRPHHAPDHALDQALLRSRALGAARVPGGRRRHAGRPRRRPAGRLLPPGADPRVRRAGRPAGADRPARRVHPHHPQEDPQAGIAARSRPRRDRPARPHRGDGRLPRRRARPAPGSPGGAREGRPRRPPAAPQDGPHRRPPQLQAAAVQAAQDRQDLRHRGRRRRLRHPDRPLLDHQQGGQPGLERPRPPVGGALPRPDGPRRSTGQPAEGPLAGNRQRRRHPRHRGSGLDRLARVARLHPDARPGRDRPVSARPGRHSRADQV
ncbi:MAG: Conserved domain protein, partial [uncultured Solirubrobacteraceae bacterium]